MTKNIVPPSASVSPKTLLPTTKDASEAPAAKRLVTDADTDSGAFHARSC